MSIIVHASTPVALVGGAELRPDDLTTALSHARSLVAADGGADAVLAAGLSPEAVIGDMDSIGPAARRAFAQVMHPVTEQESTDFDKALRHIAAPLVLAVGVTGGRFDHELAVMHVLMRHADRPCVVIGAQTLVFLCPPRISLRLVPGSLVSLFPLAPVRVASQGLRWPTDGLAFAPGELIGTSNAAEGPVVLAAEAPAMLVILARASLDTVVAALMGSGARWPAR